jgi:hypothetical protein
VAEELAGLKLGVGANHEIGKDALTRAARLSVRLPRLTRTVKRLGRTGLTLDPELLEEVLHLVGARKVRRQFAIYGFANHEGSGSLALAQGVL